MILSKHFIPFKPSDNYQHIKLIRSYYYSFDRLIDLNNKDIFLLYCSRMEIIKWSKFGSRLENMIILDNILQRAEK